MMKANNKVGLVFFPAFDWAISPTHPEREERLLYTQDQLFEEGIGDIEGIHFLQPHKSRDSGYTKSSFLCAYGRGKVDSFAFDFCRRRHQGFPIGHGERSG
jgi:hypothetical protein